MLASTTKENENTISIATQLKHTGNKVIFLKSYSSISHYRVYIVKYCLKSIAFFPLLFPFIYPTSAAVTLQYLEWYRNSPFDWTTRTSAAHWFCNFSCWWYTQLTTAGCNGLNLKQIWRGWNTQKIQTEPKNLMVSFII